MVNLEAVQACATNNKIRGKRTTRLAKPLTQVSFVKVNYFYKQQVQT